MTQASWTYSDGLDDMPESLPIVHAGNERLGSERPVPTGMITAYNTGQALDNVHANLERFAEGDWFGDASLSEIVRGPAREIVEQTLREQGLEVNSDNVTRPDGWGRYVNDIRHVKLAKDHPDQVDQLGGDALTMARRADAAYQRLTGETSPLAEAVGNANTHEIAAHGADSGPGNSSEQPPGKDGGHDGEQPRKPAKPQTVVLSAAPSDLQQPAQKLSPGGERAKATFEERITRHHRNKPLADGIARFADWAMETGLDKETARETALDDETALDGLRGFSFLGIDSPGRRDAKAGFAYAFDRAWDQMAEVHPGQPPTAPASHTVQRVGDMHVVKNADGLIDNPDGPAIKAAERQTFALGGEKMAFEAWQQNPRVGGDVTMAPADDIERRQPATPGVP